MKSKSALSFCGLIDTQQGWMIDLNGHLSMTYRVQGLPFSHRSSIEINQLYESIGDVLATMPLDLYWQFLVRQSFDTQRFKTFKERLSLRSNKQQYLVEDAYQHMRQYPERVLKGYFTIGFKGTTPASSLLPRFFSGFTSPKTPLVTQKEQVESHAHRVMSCLRALGIEVQPLTSAESVNVWQHFLNPVSAVKWRDPSASETGAILPDGLSLREWLVPRALDSKPSGIRMDGTFHQAVMIDLPPKEASESFLTTLVDGCDFPLDISLYIHREKPNKLIHKYQLAKNVIASCSGVVKQIVGVDNRSASDAKDRSDFDVYQAMIDDLATEKTQGFSLSWVVIVRHPKESVCQLYATKVRQCLSDYKKTHAYIADYSHLPYLFSCLPGHAMFRPRHLTAVTEHVVRWLPIHMEHSGVPMCYAQCLLRSPTGQVIPFSFKYNGLPSSHSLVMADTGGGKSFMVNWLVQSLRLASPDDRITIIDKGGSYRKLCMAMGGDYLPIALEARYAINPLPKCSTFLDEGQPRPDEQRFCVKLLELMMMDEKTPPLTASQEFVISKALADFYRSLTEEEPVLVHFVSFLDDYQLESEAHCAFVHHMKTALSVYVHPDSPYSVLLNRPSSLSLSNPFTVFDLEHMKSHPRLQRIYFFLINDFVRRRMYGGAREGCQQLVIFDEVWELLKHEGSAALIIELYKTARRFGTVMMSITNDPQDFLRYSYTSSIIENASIKFILKYPEADPCVFASFGLNDNEIKKLGALDKDNREVFVKFGERSFVFSLKASRLQQELCRTDSESMARYLEVMDSGDTDRVFQTMCRYAKEESSKDSDHA